MALTTAAMRRPTVAMARTMSLPLWSGGGYGVGGGRHGDGAHADGLQQQGRLGAGHRDGDPGGGGGDRAGSAGLGQDVLKDCNRAHSSVRSAVERAIAHLTRWRILDTGWRGRLSEFPDLLRTVTALEIYRVRG